MNVLFIGNSYTSYAPGGNQSLSMAAQFKAMAAASGERVSFDLSVIGGSSMQQLWNDGSANGGRARLATERYDVVVLQGGDFPSDNAGFDRAADAFGDRIDANGADTVFFGVWTPDWVPDPERSFTRDLHRMYEDAAVRNDAGYSPAGLAFAAVRDRLAAQYGLDGAYDRLTDDGLHANALGAYVAASMLYVTVFGEAPPAGWRPSGVSAADATMVRSVVARFADDAIQLSEAGGGGAGGGDSRTAAITGAVFNDLDGDGIRDRGEGRIKDATVELLNASGKVIKTVSTGDTGSFAFQGLRAGEYALMASKGARDEGLGPVVLSEGEKDAGNLVGLERGSARTAAAREEAHRDADAAADEFRFAEDGESGGRAAEGAPDAAGHEDGAAEGGHAGADAPQGGAEAELAMALAHMLPAIAGDADGGAGGDASVAAWLLGG